MTSSILLTSTEAATVLGYRSPTSIRRLQKKGVLVPAFLTRRGARLFRPEDVAQFEKDRTRKAAQRRAVKRG